MITRRALLQGTTLVIGLRAAEPLVRFGLVTDVHHADKPANGTRYYRESLRKLREGMSRFREERVAFTVELGDLVDAAKELDTELAWMKEAVRELRAGADETHYVLGNHCVQTLTKKQFLEAAGRERSHYSFDRNGVRFVVLDACHRKDGVSYDAGNFDWKDTDIPAPQRAWLRETLSKAQGKAVVFVHQRLDIPGVHSVASAPEVRGILEESGKVLAVFQGHSHQNEYREVNGVPYCTMRAVIEGSGDDNSGYSVITVHADGGVVVDGFRAQRDYSLLQKRVDGHLRDRLVHL